MKDVSDRTLTGLFIIAIFVVGGGIVLVLAKLNMGMTLITGFAELSAAVNLTVTESLSISLPVPGVAFGSSTTDGTQFEINTSYPNKVDANVLSFDDPLAIVVRNDGNSIINLTINGTLAADFIGGTSPLFKFNVTNNESGSCPFVNMTDGSFSPVEIIAQHQTLCNSTDFSDSNDEISIDIFLTVPADVSFSQKTATLNIGSFTLG